MKNVLKINDSTVVANVKEGSFRYIEQVSDEGLGIRYGGIISCMIEAQCYYKADGTQEVSEGDVLYYYQEYDTDGSFTPGATTQLLIGVFTVEKCTHENFVYSFVAYDNINKLNADFSATLYSTRNFYPQPLMAFVSNLASFCNYHGATLLISTLNCYSYMTRININYFYYSGITARDVVAYLASFCMQYVRCTPTGTIEFVSFSKSPRTGNALWSSSDAYIIAPTDQVTNLDDNNQPLIPVFYKQNGLSKADYYFADVDDYQIYDQEGNIYFRDSSAPLSSITNPYCIYENILANKLDIDAAWWADAYSVGYSALQTLLTSHITPFEVHLFPFRCPFSAGQILPYIEDAKGNRFKSVIMKLELTDSEVVLSCSGPEYYYTDRSKNNTLGETATQLGVELDGKVSKSGDTMTGNLEIDNTSPGEILKNTATDVTDSSYASPTNSTGFRLRDKNGKNVAIITDRYLANGATGLWLTGWKTVNGTDINNALALYVDKNGNRIIGVSDPAPWRSALGLGTNGALPITVGQGGTGATSTANAKANLGLGNAAQNLTFNPRTNANQIADFSFNDTNSASDYYNSQLRLIINDNGIFLHDATNVSIVWSLLTPIGVEYGGTGKTSLDTFFVDSKTVISSAPSSADLLMNYPSGAYRVAISGSQSVFPSGYGIMEVITAQDYGMIRFTRVNSTETKLYVRTYNTRSRTWYDTSWRAIGA